MDQPTQELHLEAHPRHRRGDARERFDRPLLRRDPRPLGSRFGRSGDLAVVPSQVVHPGPLGGWEVSNADPVPRRTPDEPAR